MKFISYTFIIISLLCSGAVLSEIVNNAIIENKVKEKGLPKTTTYAKHVYAHSDSCSYCIYIKVKEKEEDNK